MPELGTILETAATATGALSSASGLANELKELFRKDRPAIRELQSKFQDLVYQLLEAQMAQAKLDRALVSLQRELEQREDFEREAARYYPMDTGAGAVVYGLNRLYLASEPFHYICPTCHAEAKKSILQPVVGRSNALYCPRCKAEFLTPPRRFGTLQSPVE